MDQKIGRSCKFKLEDSKRENKMKNRFVKQMVIFIVTVIVVCALVDFLIKDQRKAVQSTYEHASRYLGKKIKIDRDSLMIVDYSLMFDRYYLSDGTEINSALVEKLIKLK